MRYILATALKTPPADLLRLKAKITDYFTDCFMKADTLQHPTKCLLKSLVSIWEHAPSDLDLEYVTFYITECEDLSEQLRY